MDLHVFARVLWRFRLLLALGLVLATVLALLSLYKVSFGGGAPKLVQKKPNVWSAQTTLLMTQEGFPYGRATQGYMPGDLKAGTPPVPVGDTARLSSLTVLYAHLANSDAVRRLMLAQGPLKGTVTVTPVINGGPGLPTSTLPVISIGGSATSPTDAVETAERGRQAFVTYLRRRQEAAEIPESDRVVVQTLNRAAGAELVSTPRKTLPAVIFLSVMTAFVALAFIFENMRPRVRSIKSAEVLDVARVRDSA